MTIKAAAATFLIIFSGTTLTNPSPNRTPIKVTLANARTAPQNTAIGCLVLLVMIMAASCVLSPNSAMNIVEKTVKSIFQFKIVLPPVKFTQSKLTKEKSREQNTHPRLTNLRHCCHSKIIQLFLSKCRRSESNRHGL